MPASRNNQQTRPLCLASRSPRRSELMRTLGFEFSVVAADIDEVAIAGESSEKFVARMAKAKAEHVHKKQKFDGVVLGCDTDVFASGRILGKPKNEAHLIDMLMNLSDSTHEVVTSVCATDGKKTRAVTLLTEVDFGALTESDIKAYWRSGEPQDKAGGYAIQGFASRWVRALRGSYSGVIGLPMAETVELLSMFKVFPSPAEVLLERAG